MIRTLSSLAAFVLFLCVSQASAGLIKVRFDDFIAATPNATPVLSSGVFAINRTFSQTGSGFFGGAVGVVGFGSVTVNYTITGGTFKDFFDAHKQGAPASPKGTFNPGNGAFTGFGFDIGIYANGTCATVTVDNGVDPVVTNPISTFGFYDFGSLAGGSTSVRYTLTATRGFVTLNSVYAVPEPTALLLVGSVLTGICSIRRRK